MPRCMGWGIVLLVIPGVGCESVGASWSLTAPMELGGGQVARLSPTEDSRFPTQEEIDALEDPLGTETEEVAPEVDVIPEPEATGTGLDGLEEPGELADLGEATEEPGLDPALENLPDPVGMPVEPGWAVRLVATVPHAHPPRAVIGLPSGIEVVVSPGSMVPEAGLLVVAVGAGFVDLVQVTPDGDHARVEQRTLRAQYGRSGGSAGGP